MAIITRAGRKRIVAPETENKLQERVVAAIRARCRLGVMVFAIPNGGERTAREAACLRRQGVVAGIPDLCLIDQSNEQVLFLELKLPKGRVSYQQDEILSFLDGAGVRAAVAYGFDEALRVVSRWGLLREEPHSLVDIIDEHC